MTHVIIVSGPPAAGKTTLARRLASDLSLPCATKDDIKETLFDTLGWKDRASSRRLGVASYHLLYYFVGTLLSAGSSLVVESNFDPAIATSEFERLHERWPFHPVQIMCEADGEVLLQRFVARDDAGTRHPGHVDKVAIEDVRKVLARGRLDPLDVGGPVIVVDTTDPGTIDYEGLLRQVRDAIGPG